MHAIVQQGAPDAATIVLLHGRGSDEQDMLPIGRLLSEEATIVAVRAPFPAAPWGYGPGYAWYRFLQDTMPEPESFEMGQTALANFLGNELPVLLGHHPGALILGGFSQGGTSSLAYAIRQPGKVAGVMVFSGFLATHPSVVVTADAPGQTPIFWGHGDADASITLASAEVGRAALRAGGAVLESHTYPGMAHTISPAELRDARSWLGRVKLHRE